MLKFAETKVVMTELPDEITLAISISGCKIRCPGCHSKFLWDNMGLDLTLKRLKELIDENEGITAVCFMGGEHDLDYLFKLCKFIKDKTKLKVGIYSGLGTLEPYDIYMTNKILDYIKIGDYKYQIGGLNSKFTNQKIYKIDYINNEYKLTNLNYKFL